MLDINNAARYNQAVIRSFRCAEAERIFRGEVSRRLPSDIQVAARRRLIALDQAASLRDLADVPGNRLEKLTGDLAGCWSIRINDRWRVCFIWEAPDAKAVEIVDYH